MYYYYYNYYLVHMHGDRNAYACNVLIKILHIYGIHNVSGGVSHLRQLHGATVNSGKSPDQL